MKKHIVFCTLLITTFSQAGENWKIHSEISYVKTSGNSDIETFAAKIEAKKNENINRYYTKGEFIYGKTDNKENTNRLYLLGRWERLFTGKLFGFLQADYLQDKFSGYNYRTVWGAGLGYDIIKTKKHYLKAMASLGYTFEDMKAGGTNDYTSGKLEVSYTWNIKENLKFKEDISYLQSLEEWTIYFINSTTSFEVKINSHLSLGVGYRIAYQHSPPSPNYQKTDTTFLTSLIFDY